MRLPRLVLVGDQTPGLPANYLVVLACSRLPKVRAALIDADGSVGSDIVLIPAEALDQWFENLQNYEATLVRCADFVHATRSLIVCAGRYGCCFFGR